MKMVLVKAGRFSMGSPSSEVGRMTNEEIHTVNLTRNFWIGISEITQAQYEAVMGNNPSATVGANLPVTNVSWKDAIDFCDKLNDLAAEQIPAGFCFNLPTEAQWEYCCRAGTTTALNNGKNLSDHSVSQELDKLGWYSHNSDETPHPVGLKQPNAWGLYDMHGNVREWCSDWTDRFRAYSVDPVGTEDGSVRGGSYSESAIFCRSAHRSKFSPTEVAPDLGFRVVLKAD